MFFHGCTRHESTETRKISYFQHCLMEVPGYDSVWTHDASILSMFQERTDFRLYFTAEQTRNETEAILFSRKLHVLALINM